ncbi:MAG: pitrilysin family protein [Candidatus Omnitrophota bacterium]
MQRFSWVLALCLAIFIVSPASAVVNKITLDNGLTVLVTEMPSSPLATIYVWVKTGAANEGKFSGSGITHFVEHMVFKGTPRRAPGVIPEEARAMGGYINASTGYDHTAYILNVPCEKLPGAVDLLADMVMNPSFDPVELERERQVIVKEMRMISDKPERKLNDLVNAAVYHVHPYQFPIIGNENIFIALKRDDLVAYHRMLYVPNNMIVAVAGGIRTEAVVDLVKKYFSAYPAQSFPLRNLPQEPEQISRRDMEITYPTALTRVVMAYQGVGLLDRDLYALDVLAMIMGQGESSRFYLELYKKHRLVEAVSSSNYTPEDRGFFEISLMMKGQDPARGMRAVEAMIAEVKEKGVSADELVKVKRQVEADNIYERQISEGMAWKSAADLAFTGDKDFSDHYIQGIRAVTMEDIKRVAARYLTSSHLNVVMLKPDQKVNPVRGDEVKPAAKIEKFVLPNGFVFLIKEDHTLPLVAVNVAFNGGLRLETLEKNGLTSILGSVWDKGLPGESAENISRKIESRGASLASYAGRNTIGLGMTFLREDMPLMMDYFEKFMKVPIFPMAEIDRAKEELRTALLERKDSVLHLSSRILIEELFKTHPFRLDSLGTLESLKRIKRLDFVDVFDRCVRSNNGVVAIVGDIDKTAVQRDLARRFGGLKPGKPILPVFSEEAPSTLRLKELSLPKDQAAVLFGFRGPMISSADRYAVEVMVNILSSSLGGRIFKRVREGLGKAYAVSGGMTPAVDTGMISFFALTSNEGIPVVRGVMEEEFLRISREPVAVQELDDAKIYLTSAMARAMQTLGSQASAYATDEVLGLGYANVDDYANRISAVTVADVQLAAKKYLDIARASLILAHAADKKK